jgi:hypothetical protein
MLRGAGPERRARRRAQPSAGASCLTRWLDPEPECLPAAGAVHCGLLPGVWQPGFDLRSAGRARDEGRGRRAVFVGDPGQVAGQRAERHGRPALIDVARVTKVTGNPLPVPPDRLGTALLRLAFRQQDTISQVSDLGLACFAAASGHGQQAQALPLEGWIAVGVLDQEPGCAGPLFAGDRSPRPANLGDHLLEPGKILGIDLPKRLRIVRPAWSRSIQRNSSARRSGFMPSG